MRRIKLNTGIEIPIIGSGTNTFGKENYDYQGKINHNTKEIEDAVTIGYRHFDTAIMYRNEAVVAKGLAATGLPRSEFFLTSKIPGQETYYKDAAAVVAGVHSSLSALNTNYIDLYLIHHPWEDNEKIASMWHVLETFVRKGILKSIGVSNFTKDQLRYLIDHSEIKPAVNQIESHPGHWNHEIIQFCQDNHIVVEAWGPLSKVTDEAKVRLNHIGSSYGKNWAQVILRYQVERNVVVIPKSHDDKHQKANLDIFDFSLTDQEKEQISSL